MPAPAGPAALVPPAPIGVGRNEAVPEPQSLKELAGGVRDRLLAGPVGALKRTVNEHGAQMGPKLLSAVEKSVRLGDDAQALAEELADIAADRKDAPLTEPERVLSLQLKAYILELRSAQKDLLEELKGIPEAQREAMGFSAPALAVLPVARGGPGFFGRDPNSLRPLRIGEERRNVLLHDMKNSAFVASNLMFQRVLRKSDDLPAQLRRDLERSLALGRPAESLARQLMDLKSDGRAGLRRQADLLTRIKAIAEGLGATQHRIKSRVEKLLENDPAAAALAWAPRILLDVLRDILPRAEIARAELWGSAEAKPEPGPVHDAVVCVLGRVGAVLEELGIERKLEIDLREGGAVADQQGLDRILTNLILNAADAMKDSPVKRLSVRISESWDEERVLIEVSDTGPGLDKDQIHKITRGQRFTSKGPAKGSGVGLPSVRAAALDAGGSFSVMSVPGRGAAFRVELPLYRGSDASL